jgi:exodeoxyribonuclease V gamma subunit
VHRCYSGIWICYEDEKTVDPGATQPRPVDLDMLNHEDEKTVDPGATQPRPVVFAYGLSALPTPTILAMARYARTADWHWFAQHRTICEQGYLSELNSYASTQRNVFFEYLNREGVNGGEIARANISVNNSSDLPASRQAFPAKTPVNNSSDLPASRQAFPAKTPVNNLQRLQQSVITDEALQLDDADAESIQIHVCHSARREVEVLYDVLLDLFNTSEVRPGDVAVVTPDPDAYRPFVEEVFRGAGRQLAVHVAGARRGAGDIGAEVVLQALKLIGSRYKVPDVLDWLESEPVLGALTDRSGLRHTLHNWILRQRIRWGIDARQLNGAGFQLSGRHTWKHGIDRLLLSWMAAEGEDVTVGELLNGSTVAGQEAGDLLGRFAAVINALADLQEASETPRTIKDWIPALTHFASEVFGTTEKGLEYRAALQKTLLHLYALGETLSLESPVPFVVVRRYLESVLDTSGLGRAWRPGTITFTGMVALHQLPFRVVAVLGLNDGKLPGKTPVSAFDLIPDFPRPGDRSRRDADRQLFLDYLLTPALRLHLSYTGMRQKDNKDMAPSVMLTMLEDFFTEKLPPAQRLFLKNLKIKHALQPFSPKYFSEGSTSRSVGSADGSLATVSTLFSYSAKYRTMAEALSSERLHRNPLFEGDSLPDERSAAPPSELTLGDLQQFFREPVKALLRKYPGLSLDEADVPGESTEPFAFDSLTGWQIRSQIMREWLQSGEQLAIGPIEAWLRRDGTLADGQAGKRQMQVLIAELKDFVRHFEDKSGQKPDFTTLEVDVTAESATGQTYRVSAVHPFMFGRTAWNLEAGKGENGVPARKKVRHYLIHLALNARWPVQYRTVFRDGKELIFRPMSSDEARLRLGNFLSLYEAGFTRPIPFFPAAMNLYLSALSDGLDPAQAFELVVDELSDEPGMYPKEYHMEMDSVWVREAWGDANPLLDEPGREFSPLPDRPRALEPGDFDKWQLFTLAATHIMDLMKNDELKAALDESDTAFYHDENFTSNPASDGPGAVVSGRIQAVDNLGQPKTVAPAESPGETAQSGDGNRVNGQTSTENPQTNGDPS